MIELLISLCVIGAGVLLWYVCAMPPFHHRPKYLRIIAGDGEHYMTFMTMRLGDRTFCIQDSSSTPEDILVQQLNQAAFWGGILAPRLFGYANVDPRVVSMGEFQDELERGTWVKKFCEIHGYAELTD